MRGEYGSGARYISGDTFITNNTRLTCTIASIAILAFGFIDYLSMNSVAMSLRMRI